MLRKTVRIDTAQNEFYSDKKGTGGEKSRIFQPQCPRGVHFLTDTIPYRPSNCNVSFFTKKTAGSPEIVRRGGGAGPGQGREQGKTGKNFNFFREKPPLYGVVTEGPIKFFREKSPLISGANRRKRTKKYRTNNLLQMIRIVYCGSHSGRAAPEGYASAEGGGKASLLRAVFHDTEP